MFGHGSVLETRKFHDAQEVLVLILDQLSRGVGDNPTAKLPLD